jgi:thymidylate synthase (FAD)
MTVTLLHSTPLWINAYGARTCWDSSDKSDTYLTGEGADDPYPIMVCGPKDAELIDRVGNKYRHASILEHVTYNFSIEGVSRALLQELARHRMASLSVKSTRYTLKELKEETSFFIGAILVSFDKPSKYLVMTGNEMVDKASCHALEHLRQILQSGVSNDIAKYCLPESYKTSLTWSINMRSLQNFLSLRSDKSALWEIQNLAHAIYNTLPSDHRYLYENHIKDHHES